MTINVTEPARLEADYEGNGAMQVGEATELTSTVYPSTNTDTIVWSTSDPLVATVDANGIVRATGVGTVVITGKLANDENVNIQIGFTVYGSEVTDDLLKLLINANSGVVLSQNVVYIGSDDGSKDYAHRIYGAVSDYYSAAQTVTRNMLPSTSEGYSNTIMSSIEFITIHDTANTGTGSGALANSNWCNNPSNTAGTSWHYTVGNDGVYQQVEDEMKAFHAGDGSRVYGLNDTGIFATDLSVEPVLTISADGYFEINALKTSVAAPTNDGVILTTADIVTSGIFITVGTNGNYFINNTWYNTGYSGNIVNMGGNSNSIGIESAVNTDSDIYLTWQKLAKLTASLLIKHNLTTDRVLAHNNFSGKVCPRTMLTAGLWDEFMSLVETEYQVKKNYSDYTITFESMNAEILDNTGRILHVPAYTTNVSYKVTVTKGEFSQSIVLNALVKGSANW
jgi:N-acetylmuramoyl-L-alanine amidase CwlA